MSFDSLPEETVLKIVRHSAAAMYFDTSLYSPRGPYESGELYTIQSENHGLRVLASTSKRLRRICTPIWVSRIRVILTSSVPLKLSLTALAEMLRERAHLAVHVIELSIGGTNDIGAVNFRKVLSALPNLRTVTVEGYLTWEFIQVFNSHPSLETVHIGSLPFSFDVLTSSDDPHLLSRLVVSEHFTDKKDLSTCLSRGIRLKTSVAHSVSQAISVFRSFPNIHLTELKIHWRPSDVRVDWDDVAYVVQNIRTLSRVVFLITEYSAIWTSRGYFSSRKKSPDAYRHLPLLGELASFISLHANSNPLPFTIGEYAIERESSDIPSQVSFTPWSNWRLRAVSMICYTKEAAPLSWISWLGSHGHDIVCLSLNNSSSHRRLIPMNVDHFISGAGLLPHLETFEIEGVEPFDTPELVRQPRRENMRSGYLRSKAGSLKEAFPNLKELVLRRGPMVLGTVRVRRRLLIEGGGIETCFSRE